jgi:hypothetical protein
VPLNYGSEFNSGSGPYSFLSVFQMPKDFFLDFDLLISYHRYICIITSSLEVTIGTALLVLKKIVFLNFFACKLKEGHRIRSESRSGSGSVHMITDLDPGCPTLFINISHTLDSSHCYKRIHRYGTESSQSSKNKTQKHL